MSDIRYEVADGICQITLARGRRNAITVAMHEEYYGCLDKAERDPDVRAVVVVGDGTTFSVGADIEALNVLVDSEAPALGAFDPMHPLTLHKPVIAAVNGDAIGLGFIYSAFADIRFASASARFAVPFARLGLVAEYGMSWLLPRLIGVQRSLDLLLSGRLITAQEAYDMGLVAAVMADGAVLEGAHSYASSLVRFSSPRSMGLIRQQVYGDLTRTAPEASLRGSRMMAESFLMPDFNEGLAAFTERRPARFAPWASQNDVAFAPTPKI